MSYSLGYKVRDVTGSKVRGAQANCFVAEKKSMLSCVMLL